ncbi:alpha/beta hydrolase [Streptomyces aidingensis]|uniref:Pimeloyl-ACP methyl ester carboxylesterase n=1 Tax=Streptomyces aidingensis TaxID=910347 RepID=A0A1I1P8R9_9ACTN|nr:alpha/beta hydrolase [Streptomyces aidingensis]SFD06304.1 Pimeloyl-ACP methyl ester carboxylesterase [Streptomyces aidingensis]
MHRTATAVIRFVLNTASRAAPRPAGALAFALFRRAGARAGLRPAEAALMRTARTETLDLDGTPVRVHRWGSGERPVLLLHGWRSRASRWQPLAEALLAAGYSPVAFDAPGHGDSGGRGSTILEYRAAVRRLRAAAGRPFEALIGHSFGGLAAFAALRDPDTARRLVTVSGISRFGFLTEGFGAQLGLRPRLETELRRRVERFLARRGEEGDVWSRFSASHRPAGITVPIMVIHDEDDGVVPVDQARHVMRSYPGQADLLLTRGLGHARILSDPGVVDAVVDFLTATATATATAPADSGVSADQRAG